MLNKSRIWLIGVIAILVYVFLEVAGLKVIHCSEDGVRAVAIANIPERVYLTRIGTFFVGFPQLEGVALIVKSRSTEEFGYFTRHGIQFESCT